MQASTLTARTFKIGTRGSPLALAQAHEVRARLVAAHGLAEAALEIVVISTSGDRILDRPLAEAGGKGLFTKEIEEALLSGAIDLAVHSMKDVPTVLPDGLAIRALLPRADVRDAFICLSAGRLADLKPGARIGTSSLRRQAQLKRLRPDIEIAPLRGNVQTRLVKLEAGVVDATILAAAGLTRLGALDRAASMIETDEMLPAVAQGAIGIEIRIGDAITEQLVQAIHHAETGVCLAAERAFLQRLDGSCRTPIAGLAVLQGTQLTFRGEILAKDGAASFATRREGALGDAARLGVDAAEELLKRAGPGFLGV